NGRLAARRCTVPAALPRWRRGAREPSRPRDQPLPPPARPQPRRLVSLGRGGVHAGPGGEQADPPLRRLLGLPLKSRDGARVVREPGRRAPHERALHQREGRPGGAAGALLAHVDRADGGQGGAPKFPHASAFQRFLRQHRATGGPALLEAVLLTCDRMAKGGVYDQIGGGFHRYAVDARWLVPHFEKMLYDNAQLPRLYLEAYQVTGEPALRPIVEETLDYALRDMRHPEGGFYSATDADSE